MIVQPHDLIFVGPIGDPGDETKEYQIPLNMAIGIEVDEVLENVIESGQEPPVEFTIKYKESDNYTSTTILPKLTKVTYSQDSVSYSDFYDLVNATYNYVNEFDVYKQPKYYDIICSLKGIPSDNGLYTEGTLELPIYERYNKLDSCDVGDTIKFKLIYGWSELKKTVSTFTNPELFSKSNIYTNPKSYFWTDLTAQKIFGLVTSRLIKTDTGFEYDPSIIDLSRPFTYSSADGNSVTKEHIEHLQVSVQSQWFSGFMIRNWFYGYIKYYSNSSSAKYGKTEIYDVFEKPYFTALICNPHVKGIAPYKDATGEPDYKYALVYYTAPFKMYDDQRYVADKDYCYLYVLDAVEGIKPVGKITFESDMYYVIPLKPGQVLISTEGLLVSTINYIDV